MNYWYIKNENPFEITNINIISDDIKAPTFVEITFFEEENLFDKLPFTIIFCCADGSNRIGFLCSNLCKDKSCFMPHIEEVELSSDDRWEPNFNVPHYYQAKKMVANSKSSWTQSEANTIASLINEAINEQKSSIVVYEEVSSYLTHLLIHQKGYKVTHKELCTVISWE